MLSKKTMFFIILFIISIAGYTIYNVFHTQTAPSPWIGREIPAFSLNTVNKGQDFSQDDLKGHPSLLTFFASWCFSCRVEHKMLGEISKKYNIPLYGIAYRDDENSVIDWLSKFGNPFLMIGFDVLGEVGFEWGILGVPETFLIDENGIVRHHVRGALYSDEEIKGLKDALKAQGFTVK